jgi:tetratricopeptide (TPR) repeat protein
MSPVNSENIEKASVEKELNDLKSMIDNFKALGVNVEAVETLLNQSQKSLNEDNIAIANTLLESAQQTYKLIKQQYFIQASSILFSSLQRTILELEGSGSEVNYVKDLYNKAKEMFDGGQYEEAMGYIKSAEDIANDLKADLAEKPGAVDEGEDLDSSQEQMELVSKTLIRVEELLQRAIDGGYAVNEAEKLYSLAEDAFDYQDYKKAETYALEAEESLKEILEPSYADEESLTVEGETPDSELTAREDLPTGEGLLSKDSKFSEMVPKGIIGKSTESDALADDDQKSKFGKSVSSDGGKSSISDLKADLKKIMERVPTKRLVKKPSKEVGEEEESRIDGGKETEKKFERDFENLISDEQTEEKVQGKEPELELEPEQEPETKTEVDLEPEPEIESETLIRRRSRRKAAEPEEPKIEYKDPALELEGETEDQARKLMKILEGRIEKSKELGFNVPMAERLFSISESYFENGEFERVLEYTKKGIKNVSDMAIRKDFTAEIGLEILGGGPSTGMETETDPAVTVEPYEPEEIQKPSPGKKTKRKRSDIKTETEKPEKKGYGS